MALLAARPLSLSVKSLAGAWILLRVKVQNVFPHVTSQFHVNAWSCFAVQLELQSQTEA